MNTVVGIKWRNDHDLLLERIRNNEVSKVPDDQLKNTVTRLLFDRNDINQCLVRVASTKKTYICERLDVDKKVYSAAEINYHPLAHLLD